MFDPCITHQKLANKIKGLEAILGPFSMILSSGPEYYKSYFLHGWHIIKSHFRVVLSFSSCHFASSNAFASPLASR